MLEQAVGELQRHDVDAALDDDVFLVSRDVNVAIGVAPGEIADYGVEAEKLDSARVRLRFDYDFLLLCRSQSAASALRSILPFAFLGIDSTITTAAGTLKAASLARQCPSSVASIGRRPARTTTKPTGTSP